MLKLTIAIPTFNGGKNLERAINSCKNIQLPSDEYEILVVDNCSTDESISNVKELRKQISNLVLRSGNGHFKLLKSMYFFLLLIVIQ